MKNVQILRGRYYARIAVPEELRPIVGKRELREPLGADRSTAQRNAHAILAKFHAELDRARSQLEAGRPTLRTAAIKHYSDELLADDRARGGVGSNAVEKINRLTAPIRANRLRLLVNGLIDDEEAEALMGYAADALSASGHAPGAKGSAERRELLRVLAEVQLDAMAASEARDAGKVTVPAPTSKQLQPQEEAVVLPFGGSGRKHTGGASLSEVLEAFHRERTAGGRTLAQKTLNEHRVAVRMFEEFMGAPVTTQAITKADILAYKAALLETPARYILRFPGLTLPQAIEANKKRKDPFPTLDPKTISMKWLSHLSTILQWGSNNGHCETNPARGIRVDTGNGFREPSRVAFGQDDLRRIFGDPFFTETKRFDSRHWALLVALYTGARSSSEIARINLRDIRQEQGVTVIELSEATKNIHSKRIVPVHDALLALGFLDHVEELRRKGHSKLFFDWQPEDKINRWFLRTYRKQVGIDDKRKVFHSFRHTLKTALSRYGVNRDVSDLITGHKDQSVGGIYITDTAVTMIQAMHEGLNRIDFALPLAARRPE